MPAFEGGPLLGCQSKLGGFLEPSFEGPVSVLYSTWISAMELRFHLPPIIIIWSNGKESEAVKDYLRNTKLNKYLEPQIFNLTP